MMTVDETGRTVASSDPIDQVARIADLRASGAVTEEEFERLKATLLSRL